MLGHNGDGPLDQAEATRRTSPTQLSSYLAQPVATGPQSQSVLAVK